MPTMTWSQGTRSASILNLGTLTSGAYTETSAGIDLGATIPYDITLEVVATPSAATLGNKQLILFAKLSLDGTNYSTGPTTGTSATNEPDLFWIGALPCNDATLHRKMFSMSGLPKARYMKIVVKNDMGVPLASGNVYRADISANSN